MIRGIVVTRFIWIPSSYTVHGLGASRRGGLLVVVCVSAAITIVSSVGADLVEPAASVFVVRAVMLPCSIWIKRTNAITG